MTFDDGAGSYNFHAALGGGQGLLRLVHRGVRVLAGRVACDLGVRLDAGEVVADLVHPEPAGDLRVPQPISGSGEELGVGGLNDYFRDGSSATPGADSEPRWGDYITVRPSSSETRRFSAFGYYVERQDSNAIQRPFYLLYGRP